MASKPRSGESPRAISCSTWFPCCAALRHPFRHSNASRNSSKISREIIIETRRYHNQRPNVCNRKSWINIRLWKEISRIESIRKSNRRVLESRRGCSRERTVNRGFDEACVLIGFERYLQVEGRTIDHHGERLTRLSHAKNYTLRQWPRNLRDRGYTGCLIS